MYRIIFILLSLISFSYAKIHITVSLPVQKYFIDKLSGNNFVIHVIEDQYIGFDRNNKEHVEDLAYSDVYFTLGIEKEKEYIELFKSINKRLKIVDLSMNIKKDFVNGKLNPYIWADPLKVRDLSTNLFQELSKLMSYKSSIFRENHLKFLDELDEIFLYLKARLDKSETLNLYAYEPFWHYFAKRFRLNLYYKENRFTNLEEISSIIKESRKHDIRKLLIKEGSNYVQARSLASHINANIVEYDISKYEWRENLYTLVRNLTRR